MPWKQKITKTEKPSSICNSELIVLAVFIYLF